MKNISHLLDVVDQVRDHVALGLMSDPGLSKTAQVKQWAERNGRRYCELIISQRMPSEISGMPMPVQDSRTMEVFDFDTLLSLKDGDVLAFDEFTNGNIQTLNACLTLIQERTMLSGKALPSLLIVAMGNPQGKCELLPQTKQRFWWVNVTWDAPTWKNYMRDRWGIIVSKQVLDFITEQYRTGFAGVEVYNYHTPRTIENLFRISQLIEQDDSFWYASDVPDSLRLAIYQSKRQQPDAFDKLLDTLKSWAAEHMDEEDSLWLHTELSECLSMDDLRKLVANYEKVNRLPEFLEFLRSTKEETEDER